MIKRAKSGIRGLPAYGTSIRNFLRERAGRRVSVGALYTTLERLEKKGYLESWRGESTPERGGKAKQYYRVVAAGHVAYDLTSDALVGATGWAPRQLEVT